MTPASRAMFTIGTVLRLLLPGASGCATPYDVQEDLSYDSAIGYHGTFDFYEPASDSGRASE